ncbi:MAG: DNA-binding transcriptional MocR family regulator [Phenylobacterium sp.]|jgi:DNA-binding transcriptional MocR family regulator
MTTAIRCYEHLESLGYVNAIASSGFYVKQPPKAAKKPQFNQFNSEVTTLAEADFLRFNPAPSHLNQTFGTAQLSPELIPTAILQRCINRALRTEDAQHFLYGNPQGSEGLCEALANHFSQQGLGLQSQQLMITNGCIDAVALALEATTEPDDVVAVTSPCFNGLLQLLALMKRRVIELPSTPD